MRRKIFAWMAVGMLLFTGILWGRNGFGLPVGGARAETEASGWSVERVSELIGTLLREEVTLAGQDSLQGWVDTALTETCDSAGGWTLITLRHLQDLEKKGLAGDGWGLSDVDFSGARDALVSRADGTQGSITKRERMALTLQALSAENEFVEETAREGAEEDTLMPLIFALHLVNNGAGAGGAEAGSAADAGAGTESAEAGSAADAGGGTESAEAGEKSGAADAETETETQSAAGIREDLVRRLVGLQLADGGWAVIGDAADVDCTAMAVQALSPCRDLPEAAEAIGRGLAALSGLQLEDGGYVGMGLENAESCAQTLLALSCLGMDACGRPDFVKGGVTLPDAMMRFRVVGGGFAHDRKSGTRNDTSSVQCLYALAGYLNARLGGGPWYVFDFEPVREGTGTADGSREKKGAAGENGETGAAGENGETGSAGRTGGPNLRWWLAGGAVLLTLGALILAAARGKRNWRSYVFPLIAGGLLLACIFRIEIQTPEGYYGSAPADRADRTVSTTISIRCDAVAGEVPEAPADGVLLASREIRIAEGETAFDQLLEATREGRIQMEYDGTAAGTYVRSIGHLYEYAFGNLSGWMYRVNGVFADVGCSQLRLSEGDTVEWVYTRNIGRDVTEESGETEEENP